MSESEMQNSNTSDSNSTSDLCDIDKTVFTRYLYIESDVCQAISSNILKKDNERAMFWASELLHSGLIHDLVKNLWNIYMTFYFSLNIEFFNYLLKNTNRIYSATENILKLDNNIQVDMQTMECGDTPEIINDGDIDPEIAIGTDAESALRDIIFNLTIRPFNTDVLNISLSRPEGYDHTCTESNVFSFNEQDSDEQKADQVAALICAKSKEGLHDLCFTEWLDSAKHIQQTIDALEKVGFGIAITNQKKIFTMLKHFKKMGGVVVRDGSPVSPVISRIAIGVSISTYAHKLKMGKKLFATDNPEENNKIFKNNRTKLRRDTPPLSQGTDQERYKASNILTTALTLSMADEISFGNHCANFLAKDDPVVNAYWHHWEYYAIRSPIWRRRLYVYGGYSNHDKKTVEFSNDDNLEAFYEEYGMDTNEQGFDIMERNLAQNRERISANQFCSMIAEFPACFNKLFNICNID